MHRKYAKQGFVAVSVSVDDLDDKETEGEVRKFLRQQKATFANFLLNETPEDWQKKLKIDGVPAVFVFNRAGQIEQKYTEAPTHAEIEKLVEQLLRQK
jgi:hypothetical protein